MDYIVNKIFGNIPQKEDEGINIYAFIIKTGIATVRESENVYIETLDINYPLNEVQEEVLDFIADATLKTYHPSQQKSSNKRTIKERQVVISAIHVIFDKKVRKLLLTEENSDIKQNKESYEKAKPLFKEVGKWMSENAELFGEDQEFEGVKLEPNNKLWHHQNYVVYPIETFSYITKAFSELENGLGFLENANILAIDVEDEEIRKELSKQIPDRWQEFIRSLPYMLIKNLSLEGRNIDAPIIIINRMVTKDHPKNEYILEREIYSFLANYLKVPVENRVKAVLERESHASYDVQDIFYLHFGGSERDRYTILRGKEKQEPTEENKRNDLGFLADIFDAQLNAKVQRATTFIQKLLDKYAVNPDDKNTISEVPFSKTEKEIEDLLNKYNVSSDDKNTILKTRFPLKTKENIRKLISSLGINPNDKETIDFLKNYIIYTKIFPLEDDTKYYKIFYSVISVLKVGPNIPRTPATKNYQLFEKIFKVIGDPLDSQNRIYYLVSSNILFPEYVFNLFCDNSVENERMTEHEVFEFNKKNGMLSKNNFVNKVPAGAEVTFYSTNVMKSFSTQIKDILGNQIKDNRFNERLTVKTISEMPYVYERVKKIVERYGLESKDQEEMLQNLRNLNVVFMSNPRESGLLGGYLGKIYRDSPRRPPRTAQQGVGIRNIPPPEPEQPISADQATAAEQAVRLAEGVGTFQRPFIILNVLNERMQYSENLSHILVHECKHYIDDLLREKGKRDRKEPVSPRQGFTNYLNSEGEQEAFTEEALDILNQYSLDYVKRNWSGLKTRIIKEYFETTIDIPVQEKSSILKALSRILDRALNLFIRDKSFIPSETLPLPETPSEISSDSPVDNAIQA